MRRSELKFVAKVFNHICSHDNYCIRDILEAEWPNASELIRSEFFDGELSCCPDEEAFRLICRDGMLIGRSCHTTVQKWMYCIQKSICDNNKKEEGQEEDDEQ